MSARIMDATDTLACLWCGVDATPGRIERFISLGRRPAPGRPRLAADQRSEGYDMTWCPSCWERRQEALALVSAHPAVSRVLGDVALHRVESGLNALELIGARRPRMKSAREILRFVDFMSQAGMDARWAARYAPFTLADAQEDDRNETRWEHVTERQRQAARDALAALLARATERPMPTPCPVETAGCAMCGVGSVYAPPSQAEHVWTPVTFTASALGGRRSPERQSGHLCPTCQLAHEEVGSIGPTAMERSLILHLGVRRKSLTATELVGLKGWAAMPGIGPNEHPWHHIEDVEQLRESLA
ncbi:hypothetical protein [Demequina salsinemoris]|uniref:hypothetical protein n=1 Tax=Demequina salsinemoris TaxID=577470 RepID=UPI0007866ECC|nr:hypothetical protein [Demequina salsinemoris]